MRLARNPETETGEKEEQREKRIGGEKEVAATKSIDSINGGYGENPVDKAKTKGGAKGRDRREATVEEDLGGVIGDDIDATELRKS